jgi:hypothetical protein
VSEALAGLRGCSTGRPISEESEELDDRTATNPALWPSDHAAVILDLRIVAA